MLCDADTYHVCLKLTNQVCDNYSNVFHSQLVTLNSYEYCMSNFGWDVPIIRYVGYHGIRTICSSEKPKTGVRCFDDAFDPHRLFVIIMHACMQNNLMYEILQKANGNDLIHRYIYML